MNFYTPVQRAKQHAGIAGEASPVEPMHVELMHRCNQAERPKTLKAKTSTHRLIRRSWSQTSVQLAITKNPARAELVFHSPRPLENLTIGGSKQVQRGSNFAGTITKILWTYPPKESTNHSMVWEESGIPEQERGFLKTWNAQEHRS